MDSDREVLFREVLKDLFDLRKRLNNYKKQKMAFDELASFLGYDIKEGHSLSFDIENRSYTILNNNGDFKISNRVSAWNGKEYLGTYYISDIIALTGVTPFDDIYDIIYI